MMLTSGFLTRAQLRHLLRIILRMKLMMEEQEEPQLLLLDVVNI